MTDRKGFFSKYIVSKTDGTPVDPMACYFVLRLDTDRNARQAAMLYGELSGDPELQEQLADVIAKWMMVDA